MSLLLEALKKAERAKQENATAKTDTAGSTSIDDKGLSPLDTPTQPIEPPPTIAEEKTETPSDKTALFELSLEDNPQPKTTEPEITEITYKPESRIPPLDLHPSTSVSETASVSPPPVTAAPLKPEREQRKIGKSEFSLPKEEPKFSIEKTEPEKKERRAAQTLFDAKKPAKKSSAPFLAVVAVLLLVMMGAGYYYWSALSPTTNTPSIATQTPPMPIRPQSTIDPAAQIPTTSAEPIGTNNVSPEVEKSIDTAITSEKINPTPTLPAVAGTNTPQLEINNGIKINRTPSIYVLSGPLANGYKSYVAGDIDIAEQQYRQALQIEPVNRDAFLGLAAIALQRGQTDNAEILYLKLLELDPRDAAAQAGLINLRGQTDASISESRIKNLLAQQPDSGALNFALGNLYATQSRWAEAQHAYFRAYSGDSENPDYLYNLAVSLDHLNQQKLALEYYQRALTLANKRPVSFDKKYLLIRIRDLS